MRSFIVAALAALATAAPVAQYPGQFGPPGPPGPFAPFPEPYPVYVDVDDYDGPDTIIIENDDRPYWRGPGLVGGILGGVADIVSSVVPF